MHTQTQTQTQTHSLTYIHTTYTQTHTEIDTFVFADTDTDTDTEHSTRWTCAPTLLCEEDLFCEPPAFFLGAESARAPVGQSEGVTGACAVMFFLTSLSGVGGPESAAEAGPDTGDCPDTAVYLSICICVYIYTHTYTYIYVYVCVCVSE